MSDSVVSFPVASFSQGGPNARESSSLPGRSTLMTSAPRSARFCPVHGAASTRERSRTRMCESGPAIVATPQRNTERSGLGRPRRFRRISSLASEIDFDSGVLDDLPPLGDLGLHQLVELGG